MEITEKLHTTSREQWRDWLADNHSTKREIWISTTKSPDGLQYLDAVEEALCFGWIDSTLKREGASWRKRDRDKKLREISKTKYYEKTIFNPCVPLWRDDGVGADT